MICMRWLRAKSPEGFICWLTKERVTRNIVQRQITGNKDSSWQISPYVSLGYCRETDWLQVDHEAQKQLQWSRLNISDVSVWYLLSCILIAHITGLIKQSPLERQHNTLKLMFVRALSLTGAYMNVMSLWAFIGTELCSAIQICN